MKKIVTILLILFTSLAFGQTYTYSYNDPCTGVLKSLVVPSNGITVSYYGQINTFSPLDFQSGAFETWTNDIKDSYGNFNPCASIVGVTSSLDMAQTSAMNVLGIMNSLTAITDIVGSIGGSVSTTGTIGSINNSTSNDKKEEEKKSGSSGGNSTQGPNSTTTTGSSSTTTGGSSTETGTGEATQQPSGSSTSTETGTGGSTGTETGSGTGTGGTTTGSGTSEGGTGGNGTPATEETPKTSESGGKSNVIGGTTKSIQKSTEKNGNGAPSIVLSSDFAGFNFKENDVNYGGKGSAGFTSVRWDGLRTHGVMVDYTSAMNGPNITAFYGFLGKKRIDLISVTGSFGFSGLGSKYATLAFGQMWSLKKPKNMKIIYMLTASAGEVYKEKFIGTAVIAGVMYDWKVAKRLDIKFTNLFIYAPFVSYYDDVVLKSPYVIMPLIGTNIGITKKFKLNMNFGTTYAINKNVMNFTFMLGTRIGL
jgi:hypothetical protein